MNIKMQKVNFLYTNSDINWPTSLQTQYFLKYMMHKLDTDSFNFALTRKSMTMIAEQSHSRAKINPKSWNWEKSHEIDYCYPVGESRNDSSPI